jgi:hypothetical protein
MIANIQDVGLKSKHLKFCIAEVQLLSDHLGKSRFINVYRDRHQVA